MRRVPDNETLNPGWRGLRTPWRYPGESVGGLWSYVDRVSERRHSEKPGYTDHRNGSLQDGERNGVGRRPIFRIHTARWR